MHYNRPVIFSKSSIEFQITPSSNMHYMLNSRPLWLDKRGDAASHNQARRLRLTAAGGSGKWPSSRRPSPTTFVNVTNRFCQLYPVRAARYDDIPRILEILDAARIRMCQSGNPTQWQPGYPTAEMVSRDIDRNAGYIIEDDGVEVAYFACLPSPDPTYDIIYEGNWLDDTLPYCVIHRIGGIPSASGIFESIMDYCFSRCSNIRIDTHRDNHVMLHLIQKRGFTYCGIIHLANGDERLAYQKLD